MGPIVDIQVARLQKLLEDRKIRLELTDAARAWLGRVGYDPVYGARPLKRAVQKYLQDPLADKILAGEIADGSTVRVDEGDGQLVLTPAGEQLREPLKTIGRRREAESAADRGSDFQFAPDRRSIRPGCGRRAWA